MKRRSFLRAAAGATTLAATWPAWLQSAFAEPPAARVPVDVRDPLAAVSDGFRRAQRAGKPLLILVVPEEDQFKWARGRAFGELLNHGGARAMMDLSLAEVVCGPMDAVRALVPQTPALPAEPLMVLVETDALPARVTMLDGTLADEPDNFAEEGQERSVDARIALLSRLLHGALAPDEKTLEARAQQLRSTLDAATLAEVERALAAGTPSPRLADRASAYILALEPRRKKPPAAWREAIAAGASARLQGHRIPGSHWASSGGCGVDIEEWSGDDQVAIGCGMGNVPPRSRRFLHFYVPGEE